MRKVDLETDEQLLQWIRSRGLVLPARTLLEVARPLSFIASQGLLLCQPLLSYFAQDAQITAYADLLADRESLDRLIAQLGACSQRGEERD
jgi:hypothetical protein